MAIIDIPNQEELSNTLASQRTQRRGLFSGWSGLESDLLGRYTAALKAQATPSQLYTRIGEELGLPQLSQTAQGLTQQVADIPATQTAAARGFDVSENQRQRIIAAKTAQLAPMAQKATTQEQTAQAELSRRLGVEMAGQERELQPFTLERDLLSDRIAREVSGYTQEMQNELEAILTKVKLGVQISEAEKDRANQLAMAEKQFQYQKQLNEQNFGYNKELEELKSGYSGNFGSSWSDFFGF